jgi:hypothetical protein
MEVEYMHSKSKTPGFGFVLVCVLVVVGFRLNVSSFLGGQSTT